MAIELLIQKLEDKDKRKLLEKLNAYLEATFTPQSFFNSLLNFVQKEIFSSFNESKFTELDKQAWIRQLEELRERIIELKKLKSEAKVTLVSDKIAMQMTKSLNKASYGKSLRRRQHMFGESDLPQKIFWDEIEMSSLKKSGKRGNKAIFKHENGGSGQILNIEKFKIFVKKETTDKDLKSIDQLNNEGSSEESEFEEEEGDIFKKKEESSDQEDGRNAQFLGFDTSIGDIKGLIEDLITSTSSTSIFGEEKCKKLVKKILINLHKITQRLHNDPGVESRIRLDKHFEPIIRNFDPKFNLPCYKPQGYLTVYGRELKYLALETQKTRRLSQNEHQGLISTPAFLGLAALAKFTRPDTFLGMIKKGEKGIFRDFFLTKIFRKVMLKLFKIRPDYHIYLEHLLIYKTLIKIHSKILEFFSVEMFNKLHIHTFTNISNIEFDFLKYLLISSRASCCFFKEFVLKFIQNTVRIPPITLPRTP